MREKLPRLGDYFESRRERSDADLPLLSVTMRDGLVPRDEINHRFESELESHEHLAIREGDIAYNMMRMWQGASGLARHDAVVSPAYVVLRPLDGIDPLFASYWFKSERMIYLFWAYSYGMTDDRLRLYAKDFAEIPAVPPPLLQQRLIAASLEECDRAIATTESLLAAKQQAKRALAARLLSCDRELKELMTFARLRKSITRAGRSDLSVELDNIESGTGRVTGFTSLTDGSGNRFCFQQGDTLFGRLRPYLFKFAFGEREGLCSTEIWVLTPDTRLCRPRYLYHLVQTRAFQGMANKPSGSRMPRADWDLVAETPLPLPALDRQDQIVGALDAAEREVHILASQAEAIRWQKRGLMQKLLTDDWRVGQANAIAAE